MAGVVKEKNSIKGVILESRSGREVIFAKSFVDCTRYADLSAQTGAEFTEPNDYSVANSMGLGNVDIERYYEYLSSKDDVEQLVYDVRSGEPGKIVRIGSEGSKGYPAEFIAGAKQLGMSSISTTVRDNYLMFIKLNMRLPVSPTNRDEISKAELKLRKRMQTGVELFRQHIPGFERAFIARTSPSLCIRRGRQIVCDYDITHENVINGDHFNDDVLVTVFMTRHPDSK